VGINKVTKATIRLWPLNLSDSSPLPSSEIKSKRVGLSKRYMIEKKVKEHNRKIKKAARRDPSLRPSTPPTMLIIGKISA